MRARYDQALDHPEGHPVKIHILDDYFDTLRTLPSFAQLDGHDVTVWTDCPKDEAQLAGRVSDAGVLVLFRDRTPITESLVARLPNLRQD